MTSLIGLRAGPGYRVRMNTLITTSAGANRRNLRLAAVVDFALAISNDHGARAAARFLDVHGAGFALTVRVLSEPERRRCVRASVLSAAESTKTTI